MNTEGGFALSFRRKWDNPVFRNKREAAIWAWMCDIARWKDEDYSSRFGPIPLKRGEVLVAERVLADDFGLSRSAVHDLIGRMVKGGMIETIRDRCPARAGTIIRLVNYEVYQADLSAENHAESAEKSQPQTNRKPDQDPTANPTGKDEEYQCIGEVSSHSGNRKPTEAQPQTNRDKTRETTKQENIYLSRGVEADDPLVAAATECAPETGLDAMTSTPTDRPASIDVPAHPSPVIQAEVEVHVASTVSTSAGGQPTPETQPDLLAEPPADEPALPLETAPSSTPSAEQKTAGDTASGKKAELDAAFDRFWKAYPRREGGNPKEAAKQKFITAVKTGTNPDVLIHAAERYYAEQSADGNVGTRYVAQALTWLNQKRWKDYSGNVHSGEFGTGMPENAKPAWMINPGAWRDAIKPPPWHDAPRGTRCGTWVSTGTGEWIKTQRTAGMVV